MVPEIDNVIVYEPPWMKATPARADGGHDRATIERLRAGGFDAAVIFTVYSQNPLPAALLAYLADIPLRLAHCRENPYQLLSDWVKEPEPESGIRHEVRRQLDLVAEVGCRPVDERLSLRVPESARIAVGSLLRERGLNPARPYLVLHPGATAPSRRYSPAGFAEAARRLIAETGLPVLITGSLEEAALVDEVREDAGAGAYGLAGALDLPGLAALIEGAALLISNNTGPAHIAAAVRTPVVDLYALTNPQHTPWQVPSRVLFQDVPCKFCYKSVCPEGHHACLGLVTPTTVVGAALDLLRETGAPLPGALTAAVLHEAGR
jgi:lipopolysaccharide heptosyltransferase II